MRRFLSTGCWDHVHPAGLTILCGAIAGALLARKSFCSWVCPVGTLERGLESVGRRFLWRRGWPTPPRWLALALTAPKHLLLAFFALSIALMPAGQLGAFIESDYNLAADAKMLLFFRDLSAFGALVLLALGALSLVFKHFWCRALCPYGALLGLASLCSPLRVDRHAPTCTGCKACARACPVDWCRSSGSERCWSRGPSRGPPGSGRAGCRRRRSLGSTAWRTCSRPESSRPPLDRPPTTAHNGRPGAEAGRSDASSARPLRCFAAFAQNHIYHS